MSKKPLHLNLCCGSSPIPGYTNIDIVNRTGTNLVLNILKLKDIFSDGSVDTIIAFHAIEHFTLAKEILKSCWDILVSDGCIIIECPDVEKIMMLYQNGKISLNTVIKYMYGDPELTPHKWGWTGKALADLLTEIGFNDIMITNGYSHNHPERDFRVMGYK